MPITTLPTQTEESLGIEKADDPGTPYTDPSIQLNAANWNEVVERVIEVETEVGLTDGSTVGSVRKAVSDHVADSAAAHAASAISFAPAGSVAATDVQAAIAEVDGDVTAHVGDATAAHAATAIAFTPDGNIAASTVQAAIVEVRDDAASALTSGLAGKVGTGLTITTTSPLTIGGGASADLSANRTLAIPAATASIPGHATAAQITKLDAIEALADVTDFANVSTALAAASGDVAFNARKLTGVADPTSAQDGATKAYVDAGDKWIPTVLAGTSLSVADADHRKLYYCTAATTITITWPSGLTAGVTVGFVQEHSSAQVQFAVSGTTLRHPATFDPYTAEQWSLIVGTVKDTDEVYVYGDLDS
jgi:hypothetical protein